MASARAHTLQHMRWIVRIKSRETGTRSLRAVAKFSKALEQAHVKLGVVILLCQTIKQFGWPRHAAAHLLRTLSLGRYKSSYHRSNQLEFKPIFRLLQQRTCDREVSCSSVFLARRKCYLCSHTRRHSDA